MARIRTIKPEFWTDEKVVECSPTARLLFIGLWNFCDDYGSHQYSPKQIKMEVFPGDDFKISKIEEWLLELINTCLIKVYTVEDKRYLRVCGWRHQKIEKPSRKHPDPIQFDDHSTTDRRPFDDDSPAEGNGREGKGKEGKVKAQAPVVELPEKVKQETWNAYLEMRRSIRKPANLYAQRLIIKKLLKMGGDMNAILEQSIMNSWQGVFELKEGGNGTGIRSDARRWLRRPGEDLSPDAQQAIADAKQAGREALARRAANRAPKDT